METLEYRKLLMMLDGQIEEAKKAAEEKARREALEQHMKLVRHQIETLASRKMELEKLGVQPVVDLGNVIARLEAEKAGLERQLAPPAAPEVRSALAMPPRLSDPDRAEVTALYDEMMNIPVEQLDHDERWMQFEVWSLRWRIVAARAGDEVANVDSFLKMCYARIRDRMKVQKEQGWFIGALDPSRVDDWPAHLKVSEEKLARLIEDRRREEEAERAAVQAMQDLETQVQIFLKLGDDGNEKMLRHHARNAAKFEHLRDEVAEILLPLRPRLEEEFSFLWKDGKEEEEPQPEPRKLTNQEIVTRIVRKMNSKRLIGGSHGPWDKICKGFPEHDKGRAKEAIEVLVKAGVLRKKPTLIGPRISIEPKMLGKVEAVIAGRPTGLPALDEWCAETSAPGTQKT